MKNEDMDILKNIILLYANASSLDDIKNMIKELKGEAFIDHQNTMPELSSPFPIKEELRFLQNKYIWDSSYISTNELHNRIEATFRMRDLDLEKAREVVNDSDCMDQFIIDIFGGIDCLSLKQRQIDFCELAFHNVFGCSSEKYCPCSFHKMKVFSEMGIVEANEDLDKATWVKKPENCLECEHTYFVAILDDIAKGSYSYLAGSGIVEKYNKTYSEIVEFSGIKKSPIVKRIEYDYLDNSAAFPWFLNGMPCNILVDYLSSGYTKKIKRCVICEKFFFAEDAKRTKCYDPECQRKYETHKKARQRNTDIVKYF